MTPRQCAQAVADAGLTGWKATVAHDPMNYGRHVACLISPDFNPIKKTGRMVVARGTEPADAFAQAVTAAQGPKH